MFDLDYAILILDIFLLFLSMLCILKPVFSVLSFGLSGMLIIQILTNTVEVFIRNITILIVILNLGSVIIGITRNKET